MQKTQNFTLACFSNEIEYSDCAGKRELIDHV